MNPDPIRGSPDDDATAAAWGATTAPDAADTADGPEAGTAPGLDVVESMVLEALTAATNLRSSPIPDEDRTVTVGPEGDFSRDDPMIGRRLGPYQLTTRIGGGDMGTVYRAARVEDFRREVAVTLIRRGRDSDAIVQRFQTESRVQGALSKHPNIAGLLDAGTTEDGRPYVVTEYVDGQRIDEYCDGRRLDIPTRLRLFHKVCEAVHFAHQHAVIHRDLKPSHILIAADGVPKLIGFGIARLIHPEPVEPVLTPDYASPEQVQGEPITTASDVYALGVVFYQLLTGRWPYRLEDRSTSEVLQAICEQVPERPSAAVVRRAVPRAAALPTSEPPRSPATAPTSEEIAATRGVSPARLKRLLSGDLDAIAMRALRKEPEARYASVEQFAADVRRFLEGPPVGPHRGSPIDRAVKFVRRNAVAVAAGLVLILALVAGIAGTTWGLILARRERDRAEESSRQARNAVNQFFTRVSEERLFNQPELHTLRKTLLQDAQRFYEEFLNQHSGDPAIRTELAAARSRVARISGEISSPAQAVPQFEQAVALWESLVATRPGETAYQEELASALNDLGMVLVRLDGRRDEALRTFRRAQDLLEPLIAAAPQSVSRRHELSLVLQNIAPFQQDQGQPEEAIQSLERSLALEAQLAAEDPRALDPRISMAKAHSLLGQVLMRQPEGSTPALESCQKAVELLEAVTRQRPELADPSYRLAMYLGDLNVAQQMAGKLDSALKSVGKAMEILERLDQRYPGVLEYQGGLASTYNMLSDLHRRRREPVESLAIGQKARTWLERLVAEHPKDVESRVDLANAHNNIARGLQQRGEPVEALRSFQRAVDSYESLPQLDPRNSYNLACNVALCIPLIGAKPGSKGVYDLDALTKADRFRRQKYGDRAVELLLRAVQGGFADLEILESDTDLDPLRDRPDFQELIKKLEKESAAEAE
jgi:serine/threonine protein kinase/tetratricopeptide (TPR) repeat protein